MSRFGARQQESSFWKYEGYAGSESDAVKAIGYGKKA